jgi:polyisoprenoid-binding protein YceI
MTETTTPRSISAIAPGRWTVDADRTRAEFAVLNFGVNTVRGTLDVVAGSVDVDAGGRPVAVRAELDMRTIATGNRRRDSDLRKPSLLDVDRFPTMTFTSDDVRGTAEGWEASGTLDVRGRSVPLVVTGSAAGSDGSARRVVGRTRLDRRDAGVRAPRIMIGREVEITLDALLDPPR